MRFGSVCSGIEAASAAWHSLGWQCQFVSEIEAFPSAVLAHHYPNVPNWGDMTKFKEWPDANIDVLVGGTPCQSFSVAGLRQGLDDPRGNLMLTYLAIAAKYRPRWLVWENVPGVLSSGGGNDFACLLRGMGELGYGFAYRILDAQYFGVPQRRRRVFVVGCLGDWRSAAAVLFERHSLQGHTPPSRQARERTTGTIDASLGRSRGAGTQPAALTAHRMVAFGEYVSDGTASAMKMRDYKDATDLVTHSLRGEVRTMEVAGAMAGDPGMKQQTYVAFDLRGREGGAMPEMNDTAAIRAASGGSSRSYIAAPMAVRRLTPRECERLQGFHDDYTLITVRGKPAADGPRYKALGNSMAVPVMRWIGERIALVDAIAATTSSAAPVPVLAPG